MPAAVGRVAGRNPLLCIALVCPHPPTEPAATGATWATLQLVGLLSHLTGTLAADPLSGRGAGSRHVPPPNRGPGHRGRPNRTRTRRFRGPRRRGRRPAADQLRTLAAAAAVRRPDHSGPGHRRRRPPHPDR